MISFSAAGDKMHASLEEGDGLYHILPGKAINIDKCA
jgi:hypothetical protein